MYLLGSVANGVAMSALALTGLSIASNLLIWLFATQRERDKIRFGRVYAERFRVCKEMYARLSRLRTAVETFADQTVGPDERAKYLPRLHRSSEAFRRSLRENDVVFDEFLARALADLWSDYKNAIYPVLDAGTANGTGGFNQARRQAIETLESIRTRLAAHIRQTYGTSG